MKKVIFAALTVLMLTACATSKGSRYQSHLKTSQRVNFHVHDNGGCAWHNN